MTGRHVVEDASTLQIPHLSYEDHVTLNRQTAFNRTQVERAAACGCFKCGSTFAGRDVTSWIEEADGEDTALCPYCETDAVIVGTDEHPLSTALLSLLYKRWFSEEFKERVKTATYAPPFSDMDDYLRKGVPFLLAVDPDVEVVGEIGLFPLEIMDDSWGNVHDNDVFAHAMGEISHRWRGGTVYVRTNDRYPGSGDVRLVTADGGALPYEPWSGGEMDLVGQLAKKYGDALKGVIVGGSGASMKLIVDKRLVDPRGTEKDEELSDEADSV